jgi:SAM-dependent methyltransferase
VDLNEESKKHGAAHSDSLSFLSLMKSASVNAIVAFGVFNEPMSLQFPAEAPPRFFLPAKGKDDATRAHCEHEYVRRLAREIVRVLKPGGVLLGDGLHSRGFETEVRTYLLRAGLMPHLPGFETLSEVPRGQFRIFDPFFFTKE